MQNDDAPVFCTNEELVRIAQKSAAMRRDYLKRLIPILHAMPIEVLQKLGFVNAVSSRVSGNWEDPAFEITVSNRNGSDIHFSVHKYWFNWNLARVYEPYYDLCCEQIQYMDSLFSGLTDFAYAPPDARKMVEAILEQERHCGGQDAFHDSLPIAYLNRLGLQDTLVEQCVAEGILDHTEIIRREERLVLDAMIAGIQDPNNQILAPHRELLDYIGDFSAEQFCKIFLSRQEDIGELTSRIQAHINHVREEYGPKEYWMMEVFGILDKLKQKIFRDGFDNESKFFPYLRTDAFCSECLEAAQWACMRGITASMPCIPYHRINEASVELFNYLNASEERYQNILEEETRKHPEKESASENVSIALRRVRNEFRSSFLTFDGTCC